MNKTLVALIASGAVLSMAACSATRTQRAPGEQVDDAALLTSVKSALSSDPVTEAGEINVDVNRGVVKLAGFVDTSKEKSKAGKGKAKDDGKVLPLDVKAGDTILFGKYSGQDIKIDGDEYLIMREDEVLAVIDSGSGKKK